MRAEVHFALPAGIKRPGALRCGCPDAVQGQPTGGSIQQLRM
jgi:hypothetical protein